MEVGDVDSGGVGVPPALEVVYHPGCEVVHFLEEVVGYDLDVAVFEGPAQRFGEIGVEAIMS